MSLAELIQFLETKSTEILQQIEDRDSKFYEPIIRKDNEDSNTANYALCVEGKPENSTMWLRIWSRDENDIGSIEGVIKNNEEWQSVGNRMYIYTGEGSSLAFKQHNEDGDKIVGLYIQIIYREQQEFKKESYYSKAQELITYVIGLLKRIADTPEIYNPPESLKINDIIRHQEIFGKGMGIMVDLNNGYIKIQGNTIILEIEDVQVDPSRMDNKADKTYTVQPTEKGFSLTKTFESTPTKSQMLQMVAYAKKTFRIR
jgi:hypothetical protein